jgi:putative cardiolipin synthase
MNLLLILVAVAGLFAAASFVAVYSWGRFARRARGAPSSALPTADDGTLLDRGVSALVKDAGGASGLAGLSDNLDAFAARALAARSAGRSLDLMYYLWHHDLTGKLLEHEMLAAADRGVRVRLLLDDINTRGRDPFYLALDTHPGIEVRLFNPSLAREGALRRGLEMILRAFAVTRRMHNKAWIADGRIAIVGGRNVGDEYFDATEAESFHDLDLVLLGPAVAEAESVFDRFWNSAQTIPIRALARPRRRRRARLDALRVRLSDLAVGTTARPYLERVRERLSVVGMFADGIRIHWTDSARVVSDPPEKALARGAGNWLMREIFPAIGTATRTVEITSPYFVPGAEGTRALVGLVAKGVDVAVLTNSLAATDVAAVHGGYAPWRRPLLQGGVRLYELRPDADRQRISLFGSRGASLHTKAFTVDGRQGFVGSFNFDPRSAALNTEMGVLFEDDGLAAEMQALFARETRPDMSYRLRLDSGALIWEGEMDGAVRVSLREPEATAMRRLVATTVGWLPVHSQL